MPIKKKQKSRRQSNKDYNSDILKWGKLGKKLDVSTIPILPSKSKIKPKIKNKYGINE